MTGYGSDQRPRGGRTAQGRDFGPKHSRRNARGHERNRPKQHQRSFSQQAPSARKRKSDPARLTAYQAINAVVTDDAYANLVLPQLIRKNRLDRRDAAFATELAYGTLRHQGRYDAILAHCSDRPLDKTGSQILTALRMGLHQLLSMRVPAHAALDSTVALARAEIGSGPASFINAVLRRASERSDQQWQQQLDQQAPDEISQLALAQSHPVWVVRALRQALVAHGRSAQEIEDLLEANNQAPLVHLVALPGIGDLTEALEQGAQEGQLVPGSATYTSGDLGRLQDVRQGRVRAQDIGSQLVARALAQAPLEGEDRFWLDLCAGPGGKAALLAALGAPRGVQLLANEPTAHRAKLVEKSLQAIDPAYYRVICADGRQIGSCLQDPARRPLDMPAGRLFDRVLVDVPCSGLGALRRRPEARWRKSPSDIGDLLKLQRQLLEAAIEVTRAGGLLAYSTCSPHMAETQNIVADILGAGRVQLLDSAAALAAVAHQDEAGQSLLSAAMETAYRADAANPAASTAQLWPHIHGTDAMFFALFRKK